MDLSGYSSETLSFVLEGMTHSAPIEHGLVPPCLSRNERGLLLFRMRKANGQNAQPD